MVRDPLFTDHICILFVLVRAIMYTSEDQEVTTLDSADIYYKKHVLWLGQTSRRCQNDE
jgi:hypothetical protein